MTDVAAVFDVALIVGPQSIAVVFHGVSSRGFDVKVIDVTVTE